MPKMHIEESIQIKADTKKINSVLRDFSQWKIWSPWLILEPGVNIKVSEDGKSYSWEGKRVGSGEMAISSIEENEILMDLTFLKPWKSKAKIGFVLKENKKETKVSWRMDSSLPFFMFWMKKMMEAMVSMDYKRGLEMLKDYIEEGKVYSDLDFEGMSNYSGCKYFGVKTECKNEEIGSKMKEDFEKLNAYLKDNNITPSGSPFSMYHKMDFVKGNTIFSVGIPIDSYPENISNNFITGEIPQIKIYSVKHTGAYKHLGNPWSAGYMMARNKEFKMNKKIHPFELYLNSPEDTEETKLETKVCFPVK